MTVPDRRVSRRKMGFVGEKQEKNIPQTAGKDQTGATELKKGNRGGGHDFGKSTTRRTGAEMC